MNYKQLRIFPFIINTSILMVFTGCGKKQEEQKPESDTVVIAEDVKIVEPPVEVAEPAPKRSGRVISVIDGIEQVHFDSDKKATMVVKHNVPVILAGHNGNKYELNVSKVEDLKAKYEWVSLANAGRSGSGKLYETLVTKANGGVHVDAAQSQCMIIIDDLRLSWTPGGTFTYLITYMTDEIEILDE